MSVTSQKCWPALKDTIESILTDDLSNTQVCFGPRKIVTKRPFGKDGYIDFTEFAGIGLLVQKNELEPITPDEPFFGGTVRLMPKTMALQVIISEEALEDGKIEQTVKASKRLRKSGWVTQDMDASSIILNHSVTLGGYDGLTLASTAHVLPGGSTTSNIINNGLGMTPSSQALIAMEQMATLMPGPNAQIESLTLRGITYPVIQDHMWRVIMNSEHLPGTDFNDINTVKGMKLDLIPIKWFDAVSPTLWGGLTDAEDGLQFREKRTLRGKMWLDNNCEAAHHSETGRWSIGWANWRAFMLGAA